jgi:lysophospholipase L1-like esterase
MEYRESVESLNARLEATAAESGAIWINLYPLFLDEADGSIRNDLANDELHLLGDGYLIWREQIRSYL